MQLPENSAVSGQAVAWGTEWEVKNEPATTKLHPLAACIGHTVRKWQSN